VDSHDLSTAQAERIRDQVRPSVAYPRRLVLRMERTGWSTGDELFQSTQAAYDAMQCLWVKLYYMSCASGVYRTPRRAETVSGPFSAWIS
jgi:hypothetical protein